MAKEIDWKVGDASWYARSWGGRLIVIPVEGQHERGKLSGSFTYDPQTKEFSSDAKCGSRRLRCYGGESIDAMPDLKAALQAAVDALIADPESLSKYHADARSGRLEMLRRNIAARERDIAKDRAEIAALESGMTVEQYEEQKREERYREISTALALAKGEK